MMGQLDDFSKMHEKKVINVSKDRVTNLNNKKVTTIFMSNINSYLSKFAKQKIETKGGNDVSNAKIDE